MLRLDTLRQHAAQKKLSSCYLFFGEEEHLKDQMVRSLATAFLGTDPPGAGLEVLYGSETDGMQIVDRALSLGMFAPRTMLVVREADALSAKSRAAVAGYLAAPNPDACLVLTTAKPDAKSALVRQFEPVAAVVNFKPLTEAEAADWARSESARRGLRLTAEAAQQLVARAGTGLGVIDGELAKLATHAGAAGGAEIGAAAVRALAGSNPQYGDYELADAVSRCLRRESLAIYQTMLSAGEDPVRILASICSGMLRLWKVASVPGDPAAVARRTGIHEYAVRQLLPAARRRTRAEYADALDRIYRAECRLKSGRGQPAALVQRLIHHLTTQSLRKA
ncbi:MAG: DNA polymerase III subunit delta [Candidatus Edwardsbacteria bacterium]|jgi:DNA polymerase-3 subunit delta|nr:DNA polymerase III subunit delta [Candidatus Edwardsbacteria bacterium]